MADQLKPAGLIANLNRAKRAGRPESLAQGQFLSHVEQVVQEELPIYAGALLKIAGYLAEDTSKQNRDSVLVAYNAATYIGQSYPELLSDSIEIRNKAFAKMDSADKVKINAALPITRTKLPLRLREEQFPQVDPGSSDILKQIFPSAQTAKHVVPAADDMTQKEAERIDTLLAELRRRREPGIPDRS